MIILVLYIIIVYYLILTLSRIESVDIIESNNSKSLTFIIYTIL